MNSILFEPTFTSYTRNDWTFGGRGPCFQQLCQWFAYVPVRAPGVLPVNPADPSEVLGTLTPGHQSYLKPGAAAEAEEVGWGRWTGVR